MKLRSITFYNVGPRRQITFGRLLDERHAKETQAIEAERKKLEAERQKYEK
jgi:hypothetical protein